MEFKMNDEKLRAKQVSKYLNIGVSTVWLYVKQGKLRPIKLSEIVTVFSLNEINKAFNLVEVA